MGCAPPHVPAPSGAAGQWTAPWMRKSFESCRCTLKLSWRFTGQLLCFSCFSLLLPAPRGAGSNKVRAVVPGVCLGAFWWKELWAFGCLFPLRCRHNSGAKVRGVEAVGGPLAEGLCSQIGCGIGWDRTRWGPLRSPCDSPLPLEVGWWDITVLISLLPIAGVLLRDVQVLTLHRGRYTTARRTAAVPQLQCIGGSAGCSDIPEVVQCYNRGWDGYDVQVTAVKVS